MLKLRKLMTSLALSATLVSGLMAAGEVSAADYNWRFANLYGRGTAFGTLYEKLGSNIEKMSDGRIKVQVLYSGEGVGTPWAFPSAVKSGLITMGAPFQSMHAGANCPPASWRSGLPGGTDDPAELQELFHAKGWDKVLEKAYGSQGLVWLEPYIQPPVFIITKNPIKSIADFKGLKIRAPGAYGKFLRNLARPRYRWRGTRS